MNASFDSFKNCYIFVCVYFTNGTTVTFINVILFMISGVFIFMNQVKILNHLICVCLHLTHLSNATVLL